MRLVGRTVKDNPAGKGTGGLGMELMEECPCHQTKDDAEE